MSNRLHRRGFRAGRRLSGARTLLPVLIAALTASPALTAQDQAPLTITELYRAVDATNPSLRAAGASSRAFLARVPGARRLPDPQLEFQLMNRDLPGFELNDPLGMTQVQVMQMVPLPGKLGLAGNVAQARADAEGIRVGDVAWEQRARAAMAFYDLYRAGAVLDVSRGTLRLLEDLSTVVTRMYAVGEARQADVLRAQLEIGRMSAEIEQMEAMRSAMRARLNAVLDRAPDAPVGSPVLPELPDSILPSDSLLARALAYRPMLRAGEQDLHAAGEAERLAHREIWPDLTIGAIYGQRPMDGGGTERMLSLMFGVNVPLWAGSRQLRMRDEAAAMREMAQADLDAMRAETRGRIGELVTELGRTRRLRSLYLHSILPQAEATATSARTAYQVGNVDFMTLLDALMAVNTYRELVPQLEAQEGQALAELEMLTGLPLVPGVPTVEDTIPGDSQ